MTETKDGGPAYPSGDYGAINYGMSLRDWFAGRVLTGLYLANRTSIGPGAEEANAIRAYAQADAMLKARESGQ